MWIVSPSIILRILALERLVSLKIEDFIEAISNIEKAKNLYKSLIDSGVDVLLDDIEENISNKFKKHDLIGIPYQIIVGSKTTKDEFEFKEVGKETQVLKINKIINLLKK